MTDEQVRERAEKLKAAYVTDGLYPIARRILALEEALRDVLDGYCQVVCGSGDHMMRCKQARKALEDGDG